MDHEIRPALPSAGPTHDPYDRYDRAPVSRATRTTTLVVGALLTLDVGLGWAGYGGPFGVSPALVAAVIGGARLGFRALAGRAAGEIAPVVVCAAALFLGESRIAAGVVLVTLAGQCLVMVTLRRARRALQSVRESRPKKARVSRDGKDVEVAAEAVVVGDRLVVRPGEKVAADGVIVEGRSAVDQSVLTGEGAPVARAEGDPVFAGTVNHIGRLDVRVRKVGTETTLGKVIGLLDEARRRRSPPERSAETYARVFLPAMSGAAGLVFLATNARGLLDWSRSGVAPALDWMPALAALVAASPGAVVLATAVAVRAASARLARRGVMVKGGEALERLAVVDAVAFDRTGTLTEGRPEVGELLAFDGVDPDDLLRLAASAEQPSAHPLARMLLAEARRRGIRPAEVADFHAVPGAGVSSALFEGEGRRVLVGNLEFVRRQGLWVSAEAAAALAATEDAGQTALLVAVDGRVIGVVGARDRVRAAARGAVDGLKNLGLNDLTVLAGDGAAAARATAGAANVGQVAADLNPAGKGDWVRRRQADGRSVAYVGDDPAALAAADVGLARAGLGADLAALAGSVVLMGDPVEPLPEAVRLARRTVRVIRRDLRALTFGLNAVAVVLAGLRVIGPVGAAAVSQAGSLLALWDATRLMGFDGFWRPALVRASGRLRSIDRAYRPASWPAWLWDRRRRLPARALVAAAVVGYLATGLTVIGPDEVGLVQRFGAYRPPALGPGLHLTWPAPLESVLKVEPDRVRVAGVGARGAPGRGEPALFVTGDENLVELSGVVEYRLTGDGAADLVLGVASVDAGVAAVAEGVFREAVANAPLGDLLGSGRRVFEMEVGLKLRDRLAATGLKVALGRVAVTDVRPPRAVAAAYDDVSAAVADAARARNEAGAYATGLRWSTRAEATEARDAASARGHRLKVAADGDRQAFLARASSYAAAPDLTEFRLWCDTLADAYAGRDKLILAPGAGRVLLADPDPKR